MMFSQNPPRILILFFSGTGNTQFIAEYLQNHLESSALDIHVQSVESIVRQNRLLPNFFQSFDLLLIGYPVYALKHPRIIDDFLALLPSSSEPDFPGSFGVYAFCTKGAMAGNTNRHVLKFFAQKGYHPLGELIVGMPGSDGLAMLKPTSKYVTKALQKDFQQIPAVDQFIAQLLDDVHQLQQGLSVYQLPTRIPRHLSSYLVEWLFRLSYNSIEKSFKKKFVADTTCTRCKWCETHCPVQNITVDEGGVHFSDKCMMCMRCVNGCPTASIQIGNLTRDKFRWHGPDGKFKPHKYL